MLIAHQVESPWHCAAHGDCSAVCFPPTCALVSLPVQACCVLVAIGAAQAPAPLPLICVLLHRAQDETVTASLVAEWSRIKPSGGVKQQPQQQQLLQQQRQQQLRQLPLVPLAARVFEAVTRGADSGAGRQAGSDRLARSQAVARSAAVAAAIHALSCEGRASLEAALQSRAAGRCLHEHLPLLSEPAVRTLDRHHMQVVAA